MSHPSVSELLAASAGGALAVDVAAHVDGCASCRRLVARGQPVATAEAAAGATADDGADLAELLEIDPALYVRVAGVEVRGGMGRTFVARDRRLGREVAIKQPLGAGDVADPVLRETLRARFEREARLTARLEHPAIVGVHEAGRFPDGEAFYAMRLVQGPTLAEEIARLPALADRLALLPNLTIVAEALAYAHSRGVTHRDVKPANILLGAFGETVLIDWGLAADAAAAHTGALAADVYRAGEVALTDFGVGTPGYMAPEQARGAAPGAAADVYGLGATLLHLIIGRPPGGEGAVGLRARAPGAPPPLVALVTRAMAERPADRFATAAELAAELRRFHAGQLMASHRYSPRELVRHYLRRFRGPLAIAALAALILLAVSALYVRGLARSRARTERARVAAEASDRAARAALRRQLGVTASQLARVPARRIEALTDGVQAVAPALAAGEPIAPEAWQGLIDALAAGPVAGPLIGHHGALNAAAVLPGGAELLTAGPDHALRRWTVPSGQARGELASALERPNAIAVTADGRWALICGFDLAAELVPLAGGPAIALPLPMGDPRCDVAPDGHAIVAAGAEVRQLDVATGTARARAELPAAATALAIAPDGLIAVGTVAGELVVWRPGDPPTMIAAAHPGGIREVRFVDGGGGLLSGGVDGRAVAWTIVADRATAPRAWFVAAGTTVNGFLPVAEDGRIAIATSAGLTRIDAHATTLLGGGATVTLEGVGAVAQLRPGWIGPLAALSAGGGRLLDPATGRDLLRLPSPADRAHGAVHVGDALLVYSTDGAAMLWDVRSGPATGQLLGHTAEIAALVPVGDRLWSAALDGTVRGWAIAAGAAGPVTVDVGSEATNLVADPRGAAVATLGVDGAVRLIATGADRPVVTLAAADVGSVAFDRAGAQVLTGADRGRAQLWRAATGEAIASFTVDGGAIDLTTGGFAPDGARAVVGASDGSLRALDLTTGAVVARLTAAAAGATEGVRDPVDSLRFTADGTALVVGFASARTLVVDGRSLAPRARLEGRPIAILPDRTVVALAVDGRVLLHPLAGGRPRILTGGARPQLVAAVSADGARLAAADQAGVVRIWDLPAGTVPLQLEPAAIGLPTALAFVDGDRALAIGGSTGGLRLIAIEPRLAVARACALLAYFERRPAGDACP